jgi:thymidine kinase
MFSGKTTRLIRRLEETNGNDALVIKHEIDTRYRPGAIVTHDGTWRAAVLVRSSEEIAKLVERRAPVLVAVDEAHFFDEGLAAVVDSAAERGSDVVVTCLEPDSWGRPMTMCRRLMAIADTCIATSSVCARCGSTADRTQRLTPIIGSNLVGGAESFEPRCRRCWRAPPEPPPD